jgi:hypothetical protein
MNPVVEHALNSMIYFFLRIPAIKAVGVNYSEDVEEELGMFLSALSNEIENTDSEIRAFIKSVMHTEYSEGFYCDPEKVDDYFTTLSAYEEEWTGSKTISELARTVYNSIE